MLRRLILLPLIIWLLKVHFLSAAAIRCQTNLPTEGENKTVTCKERHHCKLTSKILASHKNDPESWYTVPSCDINCTEGIMSYNFLYIQTNCCRPINNSNYCTYDISSTNELEEYGQAAFVPVISSSTSTSLSTSTTIRVDPSNTIPSSSNTVTNDINDDEHDEGFWNWVDQLDYIPAWVFILVIVILCGCVIAVFIANVLVVRYLWLHKAKHEDKRECKDERPKRESKNSEF